jgi:U3 small nucleolar RNA-associated protein 20
MRWTPLPRVQSQQGGKLTPEQIQARVAAVASVCIEQLAEHTRRGKAGELWDLLLPEAHSRLDRLVAAQQAQQAQQAEGGSGTAKKAARKGAQAGSKRNAADASAAAVGGSAGEELAAATASAARGVALLAQLLEHGRGCRVDDYEPLFQLAARLVRPEFFSSSGSSSSGGAAADEGAPVEPLPRGASAVYSDFLHPSLSAQVLRLLLALTLSHAKVAGASLGPASIAKAAPQWAPVFQRAPARELLPFIRSLISYPGGYDVARFFSQHMLGTLGRCLLAGGCLLPCLLPCACWLLLAAAAAAAFC